MTLASVIQRSKADAESWRYTDLEKFLASSRIGETRAVNANAPQTKVQHCLVFIDGVWQPDQSQPGDLPKDIMQGDADKGYKLSLAGQTCLVTSPVQLLFQTTKPGECTTKLDIDLGVSGRLTLIESHEPSAHASIHTLETTINLQAQAKLVHGKIIKAGANAVHLALTKAQIAEGAFYDNFTLITGGKLTRNEIEARLNGKMAQCSLNGAMLMRGSEHADTTTRITHAAPYGTSREMYKSVLAEKARAVFQGKILVEKGAQKTDGRQLNRALLLSDQAEMDAKPELEIYADDVKCSHGCTIGDLDDQALFYLRTRGLNEQEARALLVQAFVGEILDEIHTDDLRDLCRAEVESWLL